MRKLPCYVSVRIDIGPLVVMDQTECTHQTHEESDEGSQICQGDAWHIAVGNFTLEGLEDEVELFLVAGTASTTNLGQWHAAA